MGRSDGTWRPLIDFQQLCVVKKYSGYKVNQPFSLQTCDINKRKNKFSFDLESGLIYLIENQFCVTAPSGNNARLRVGVCDEENTDQIWNFDEKTGQIYLRKNRRSCIVVSSIDEGFLENSRQWLKISHKCYSNTFGIFQ